MEFFKDEIPSFILRRGESFYESKARFKRADIDKLQNELLFSRMGSRLEGGGRLDSCFLF